jgi:hypothetical protein
VSRNPDYLKLLKLFSSGAVGATLFNLGPDKNFAERWWPTVASRRVRMADTPADGFDTKFSAKHEARRYKEACRDALSATTDASPKGDGK